MVYPIVYNKEKLTLKEEKCFEKNYYCHCNGGRNCGGCRRGVFRLFQKQTE